MKKPEAAQSLVKVDPLEIEFGLALLSSGGPGAGRRPHGPHRDGEKTDRV
jgi:hypothetical protein